MFYIESIKTGKTVKTTKTAAQIEDLLIAACETYTQTDAGARYTINLDGELCWVYTDRFIAAPVAPVASAPVAEPVAELVIETEVIDVANGEAIVARATSTGIRYISDLLLSGSRERIIWTSDVSKALALTANEAARLARKTNTIARM